MAEEMTKVQQLGVLTALQKMVKAKADQLRKEVNAEMSQDYLNNKSGKDRPVLLDGIKVGNIVMSIDEKHWEVTDPIDYEAFLFENGQMNETWSLNPAYTLEAMRRLGDDYRYMFDCKMEPKEEFLKLFEPCGDAVVISGTDAVVPGVSPCGVKTGGIKVYKCEPKKVAPILARIGGLDAMLLGDGSHE